MTCQSGPAAPEHEARRLPALQFDAREFMHFVETETLSEAEAEQLLRSAERVVFIGYSLPEDDVEVVYLLKRSLAHLTADRITVVEHDEGRPACDLVEHQVGR